MSRWIDIDDISLLKTVSAGGLSAKALWKLIRQQPSIDLVRCGECKRWRNIVPTRCTKHFGILVNADDFCSHGERKESDDRQR